MSPRTGRKEKEEVDRRFYRAGAKKGEARLSRKARARERQRTQVACMAADSKAATEGRAMEDLVSCMEKESLVEATGEEKCFRLGRGVRETREGVTCYLVDSEDDEEGFCGRWIEVSAEDVVSGRRWFRERYPEAWTEEHTEGECVDKALRTLESFGQEYVEYEGRWFEVDEAD